MKQRGLQAEQQARSYLEQQGLKLLEQNLQCRFGEIDLIMRHNNFLVFVEVKYRQQHRFGGAVAAVTSSKQNKLRLTAQWYLQQQGWLDRPCRFDVIAIEGDQINWIENAF